MTLTTENANATNAAMPQGLHYAARVDWLQKRDMLRRVVASAAPVVASADTAALMELESAAGCNHFEKLDSAPIAPRPYILINSPQEAALCTRLPSKSSMR